ncbi:MAG: LuxR C-terminal-related transcriptional regulator [Pseudolysinimonas sp.]|uniref:helix-turn-helix transcriptional regulator n=1 Tax=Pseudolysinimonas sp. TaxID=2680009 RepID=UPI00326758E7
MLGGPVSTIPGASGALAAPRTSPVRLAILDDHEVLLDSMNSWVAANAPDFTVVVMAPTWLQLVHSPAFPTELVFIDFQLKEPVSIEARVRTCRAAGAKVIVLSSVDTSEARERALAAGAAAFLAKSLSMESVMDAARRVMGMPAGSADRPLRPVSVAEAAVSRPKLSPGEADALRLYTAGMSTVEVAEKMNVQYETAKTYLRRVREKYARVNRPASKKADLIRRAAEDGYLE